MHGYSYGASLNRDRVDQSLFKCWTVMTYVFLYVQLIAEMNAALLISSAVRPFTYLGGMHDLWRSGDRSWIRSHST